MKKFIIAIIIALCTMTTAFADDAFIHGMKDFTADCDTVRVELQETWYDANQAGETLEINNVPHEVEMWLGSLDMLQVNYKKYIGEDLFASGEITAVPHGNGNHKKCVKGTVNFWCDSYEEIVEEPDAPVEPEEPVTPEEPEVPETPAEPEIPKEPEVPEAPTEPETPEVPETPKVPTESETPDKPEVPETPVEPKIPENNIIAPIVIEMSPKTADAGIDAVCMIAALSFLALLALGYYKFKDR